MKILISTLLLLALPAFSQAVTEKAKDEIVALENRWLVSLDDPQALESILADDFVHVLPSGIITKRQQLDFQRMYQRIDHIKRNFEGLRVRIYGDVAIANGAVIAMDERGSTRKTYFTDVFARRNGRWQAVNAQEDPAEPPRDSAKH